MVISVHYSFDLVHIDCFAVLWLEDQDIVVRNQLGFIIFVRSDAEVAQVFAHIDTGPVLVLVNLTGKIGERHTVSVPGRRTRWCVSIYVSINPDNLGVRHELLHSSD